MGDLIGILSTVILVSTVCTLIFAVGAYVAARRNRESVNTQGDGAVDADGNENLQPDVPRAPTPSQPLFRRVPPTQMGVQASPKMQEDDTYEWK